MPARTTVMFALVALPAFAASPGPIEAHYECSTGTRLSATFSSPNVSPGSVILVFAGARRLSYCRRSFRPMAAVTPIAIWNSGSRARKPH